LKDFVAVISFLIFSGRQVAYVTSTMLLLCSSVIEAFSLVNLISLLQSYILGEDIKSFAFVKIDFNLSETLLIIIALLCISSLLSYFSSRMYYQSFAKFEQKWLRMIFKDLYLNSVKNPKKVKEYYDVAVQASQQGLRIISESNYYLRYLIDGIVFSIGYIAVIVFQFGLIGVLISLSLVLIMFLLLFKKNKSTIDAGSNNSINNSISNFSSYIKDNFKQIFVSKAIDQELEYRMPPLIEKIERYQAVYISSDFKKSVLFPSYILILVFIVYLIENFTYLTNMEAVGLLLLVYRLVPRLSYMPGQVDFVSRAASAVTYFKKFSSNDRYEIEKINLSPIYEMLIDNNIIRISGASGAGKSTFLDALAGLGVNENNGKSIKVCYVTQEASVNIPSEVEAFARLYNLDKSDLKKILFSLFNTYDISLLSIGQRQQLLIEVLILNSNYDLYLFDEITSAIDSYRAKSVFSELKLWAKTKDKKLVCITHQEFLFDQFDETVDIAELNRYVRK
jgi:ABC-type lipoprotein export system ATPase subunit